jgi:peptidoglycan/LPS O-acetylase OafA/YrhL
MSTKLPTRALDVLRAGAVLCVLVDHTIVAQTGETLALWTLGRIGVLVFFVHTSLVLMASLERRPDGALAFYVRRAFRIYPLAIVTVLAVVALDLPTAVHAGVGNVADQSARTILGNLTLTANLFGIENVIGPLWSLPLEVEMYVVLPACYLLAQRGARRVVWLLAIAVALSFVQRTVPRLWRLHVLSFAPMFLLGVLAFAWLRTHSVGDLRSSWLTGGAHAIATYSYGIYLLHVPALGAAFVWGHALPRAVQWGVYATLIATLPVAAYHAIEAPGIALGQRLAAAHLDVRAEVA